ncbi:GNAT family N-acetyltransferase [Saccharopolyspora shandongensis]|uniref:GNAT family N-acetyltransferase n=1 Tax=Saccharopolyspora shandongensis TaxID=418495 RepID=UPI0033E6670A
MTASVPGQSDPSAPFGLRRMGEGPSDWALVVALVLSCSTASLRSRFALPRAPTREELLRRFRGFLLAGPPDGVALLATAANEPVGLLNLVPDHDHQAEMAVLVADAWQHHGVGTYLTASVREIGRWQGWTVRAVVETDNRPARALLRRHRVGPTRCTSIQFGQWQYTITVAAPQRPTSQETAWTTTSSPAAAPR